MDRKSNVNQWDICTVCDKNVRQRCPRCDESGNEAPCWIIMDNITYQRSRQMPDWCLERMNLKLKMLMLSSYLTNFSSSQIIEELYAYMESLVSRLAKVESIEELNALRLEVDLLHNELNEIQSYEETLTHMETLRPWEE